MASKNNISDEELMTIVQQTNDEEAFDLLYYRYEKLLFAYFLKETNDNEKSKDLVQQVFVRVITDKKKYNNKVNFKSWLFKIAKISVFQSNRYLKKNRFIPYNNSRNGNSEFELASKDIEPLDELIIDEYRQSLKFEIEFFKLLRKMTNVEKLEALRYLKAISKKHKPRQNLKQGIQEGETIEIKGIKFPTFKLGNKLNNVNIRDFAYDDEGE